MKKLTRVFGAALLVVLFHACKKRNDGPPPALSVDKPALSLGIFQGYSDSFEIQSGAAWTMELSPASAAQWMDVSAMQGGAGKTIVRVSTIAANTGTQTAVLTVKPAGRATPSVEVTVTQKNYAVDWKKMLGGTQWDEVRSMARTADGGLVIAGLTLSDATGDIPANYGYYDGLVAKMSADGAVEWTKTFGGTHLDYLSSIAVTPDGGLIVCGVSQSNQNGDLPVNHGNMDAWVAKLNSNGEVVWSKLYGGYDHDEATSVAVTPEGGFIIVGETESNNNGDVGPTHGNRDAWVFKLNQSGDVVWSRVLGGDNFDRGKHVVTAADGSSIVVADTYSNDSGDVGITMGLNDAWVLKLDSNGQILWNKLFGGSNYDEFFSIAPTPDNGFVMAGYTESVNNGDVGENKGEADAWVMKIDGAGIKKWSRTYGGDAWDEIQDVAVTPEGDLLLTGYTGTDNNGDVEANHGYGDIWLLKLNNKGDRKWSKTIGGMSYEFSASILTANNGEFVVGGSTASSNTGDVGVSNGHYDLWIVKFK